MSWCIEITVDEEAIRVEADVRTIHSAGQDTIWNSGEHAFTSDVDFMLGIHGILEQLCDAHPI